MAPSQRMARVNRMLQTTLAEMLGGGVVRDPRISALPFISISSVRCAPDLRTAVVHVAIPASAEQRQEAMDALLSAGGYLRRELGQRVKLRYTPELRFTLDDTLDSAAHIEQILDEIHAEQGEEERD